MGNQNKGNLEKYKASDWSKLSRRARGPRGHRAAKIKARMVQHIQSRDDLTPSAKLAGAILVRWYNERLGYSWPPTSTLAAEVGLSERSIQRATGELDELGVVHKVVGGGWDRSKIRYRANKYYPAFSLVLEPAENGGNLRNIPDNLSAPTICQGTKSDNRQNSAEHPRHIVTPYGDNDMANASASPIPADASIGSHAPAPELEELPDLHYSVIAGSDLNDHAWQSLAFQAFVELTDTLAAGQEIPPHTCERLNKFCAKVSQDSNYDPASVNCTKATVATLGAQVIAVSRSRDGSWSMEANKGLDTAKVFQINVSWIA